MPRTAARPPGSGAPRWAHLIYSRREAMRLSQTQAAAKIGMTQPAWAAIERAEKNLGGGIRVPYRGSDVTVAEMARLLGITPAELEASGRVEAAEVLQILLGLQPSVAARVVIAKAAEAVAAAAGADAAGAEEIRVAITQAVDRVTANPQ